MITTFLFDIGGVFFEADWEKINQYIYQKTGVPIFPLNGGRYDFYVDFSLGEITINDYFKRLRKEVNSTAQISSLKKAYKKAYTTYAPIYKEMLKLIVSLHTNYFIACVTNTNRFHEKINQERGLFKEFDKKFTSYKYGALRRIRIFFQNSPQTR